MDDNFGLKPRFVFGAERIIREMEAERVPSAAWSTPEAVMVVCTLVEAGSRVTLIWEGGTASSSARVAM